MSIEDRPTVAVIGGGFSGLLVAVHLLSQPDGPAVRLIERRADFARGAAYSSSNPDHLLNVRAANMSAFPDAPAHFIDWLASEGDEDAHHAFVTRDRYGAYLQSILKTAMDGAAAGRLTLEADSAIDLRPHGAGWRVTLAEGGEILAAAVVLAVGNLPPRTPAPIPEAAVSAPGFIADPWRMTPETLPHEGTAVLLGTGLTMIDVALLIAEHRPRLRMLALSRRGLLPHRHAASGHAPHPWEAPSRSSLAAVLRALRRAADKTDWRAVVDGVRPHVQGLWRGWSIAERQRFLRHARPWWDIHRHRLAPPVAAKLDAMTASGALTAAAGAIASVAPTAEGLDIAWRRRGQRALNETQAAVMINCTGPNGDLARADDPLLNALVASGVIRADPCGLGVDVDEAGRLIGADGAVQPRLFGLGPVTRGMFWEITSVPDIRIQAAECAARIAFLLSA
jgi:uncharacterized NAD(P)/FAD-binding protein YdhS